jgi:2-polyprenyl-3-methyl-5-hydroxy-6-metoxy-1,4-benzoquinol methylase
VSRKPRFGEQRLVLPEQSAMARLLYRAIGLADPAHWLHARYFQQAVETHMRYQPRTILDAGCGRGDFAFWLARRFPGADVLGVDIDQERIARNRETAQRLGIGNARFEVADIAAAAAAARFDFICAIDVLEHVPHQEEAFRSLAAALNPGGLLFIHIPTVRLQPVLLHSRLKDFHEWGEKEHVAEERTAEQVEQLVRSTGLQITESRRTFARYTGELATGLFNMPYRPTLSNQIVQALLALPARALAMADSPAQKGPHYALALSAHKPHG